MKKEIYKAAANYKLEQEKELGVKCPDVRYCDADFEVGANWMLKQYNGVTPDTVTHMISILNKMRGISNTVDDLLKEADQEMKDYEQD